MESRRYHGPSASVVADEDVEVLVIRPQDVLRLEMIASLIATRRTSTGGLKARSRSRLVGATAPLSPHRTPHYPSAGRGSG